MWLRTAKIPASPELGIGSKTHSQNWVHAWYGYDADVNSKKWTHIKHMLWSRSLIAQPPVLHRDRLFRKFIIRRHIAIWRRKIIPHVAVIWTACAHIRIPTPFFSAREVARSYSEELELVLTPTEINVHLMLNYLTKTDVFSTLRSTCVVALHLE